METKLARKDRLTDRNVVRQGFESFIVIRCTGADVEVHVVGASQSMVVEIVDQIHACIVDDFLSDTSIVDHDLDGDQSDVRQINVAGTGFAPATGVRVTFCEDVTSMKTLLEATFENVMVAK